MYIAESFLSLLGTYETCELPVSRPVCFHHTEALFLFEAFGFDQCPLFLPAITIRFVTGPMELA